MVTLREQIADDSKNGNNIKKLKPVSSEYVGVEGHKDTYTDDKGNKFEVYENFHGGLSRIDITDASGKKISINSSSLEYHGVSREVIGKNGKPIEGYDGHAKILKDLKKDIVLGKADVAALFEQYKDFEYKPVTQEELNRRSSLEATKNEWQPVYEQLYEKYGGGMTFDGSERVFDESSQTYKCGYGIYLADHKKNEGYAASVEFDPYGKLCSVALSSPEIGNKGMFVEVLNMENLQKKGLTAEQAEAKIQEIAEQIRQGADLKQLFLDNRQYMGDNSQERLDIALNEQPKQKQPQRTITKTPEKPVVAQTTVEKTPFRNFQSRYSR